MWSCYRSLALPARSPGTCSCFCLVQLSGWSLAPLPVAARRRPGGRTSSDFSSSEKIHHAADLRSPFADCESILTSAVEPQSFAGNNRFAQHQSVADVTNGNSRRVPLTRGAVKRGSFVWMSLQLEPYYLGPYQGLIFGNSRKTRKPGRSAGAAASAERCYAGGYCAFHRLPDEHGAPLGLP